MAELGLLHLFAKQAEVILLINWCEDYDINYNTVQDRLLRAWSIEDALSKKVESKYTGGGL